MKRKFNKKGFQVSFGWLFGIIVGGFILFLAIYGVAKLISTEKEISDAEGGKEIGVALNLLEIGFEESKSTSLIMPIESRIHNRCSLPSSEYTFGKQGIKISQKSLGKWSETNTTPSFQNKYIFSNLIEEGKTFYLFAKPFKFPFKVADLVYVTSSEKKYCFKDLESINDNADMDDIYSDISNLHQKNLLTEDCADKGMINVCFSDSDCEIYVSYQDGKGYVNKRYSESADERINFYGDALMFAAIFSEKRVYDCQLNRLMKRANILSGIYQDKIRFLSRVGCTSDIDINLEEFKSKLDRIENSDSLQNIAVEEILEKLTKKNDGDCQIW